MKNKADYSKYECPYSHLEKESGHELHGPEGYQDVYGVWCACGFRAPVFYLDPDELGLKLKNETPAEAKPVLADSAIRDALSKIMKVSASLVSHRISPFIEDWDLPKTTTKKVKIKIVTECDKWNEVDRKKAIELKDAYDVLIRHFR